MPTPTYIPLANITLGSSTTSVNFSSIAQTYKDLVLVAQACGTTSGGQISLTFNGNTSLIYSAVTVEGNGTSSVSNYGTFDKVQSCFSTDIMNTTIKTVSTFNIMDYSATDKHKTVLVRSGNSSTAVSAAASRWPSTSAITSIQINGSGRTFAAGATFELFGVAA